MDVAVAGGGIIGCAVAWELARRGVRVTVFEDRGIAAGATFASAGVLAPYVEAHEDGVLLELGVRSLGLYDTFVRDASSDSGHGVEYARCGSVEIASDESEAAVLRKVVHLRPEQLRWLEGLEVAETDAALRPGYAGAALASCHGHVAADQLTNALAVAAQRHGAVVVPARVNSVQQRRGRPNVISVDGDGREFDWVVIACGSWSGMVTVDDDPVIPVFPVKGQLLRVRWSGPAVSRVLWGPGCYVVPRRGGYLLVGATVEDAGFDERTTDAAVNQLMSAVREMLPAAAGAELLEARAGLRPATPDGLPVIGASVSSERTLYATGHFRNGILLAPLTAVLLADLIVEGREDPALVALSPRRFT
ncbi:MAG: glycine oxidase ThiO [Vicinamibacterales bacterium]